MSDSTNFSNIFQYIFLNYNYSSIFFEKVNNIYANKILFCYKEWSIINEPFKKKKQRVLELVTILK
jgi:hypothetical protein